MACVSDVGYLAAGGSQAGVIITQATINAAIQVAVALYQRNASSSISHIQTHLADQQVALAEAVQAHAVEFWPAEDDLVEDVFGVAKGVTDYPGLAGVYDGIASAELSACRQDWIDTMRAMCMAPARPEDTRWQRSSIAVRADIMSYSARTGENRTQALNDRRYARELAVLGLGRGLTHDLVTYQSIAQATTLSAAGLLEGGLQSALNEYAYFRPQQTLPSGWGQDAPQARMPAPMTVSAAQSAPVTAAPSRLVPFDSALEGMP